MDGECPISTADPGDTFIHHSDSFGGLLVASRAPWGVSRAAFWLTVTGFWSMLTSFTRSTRRTVEDVGICCILAARVGLLDPLSLTD